MSSSSSSNVNAVAPPNGAARRVAELEHYLRRLNSLSRLARAFLYVPTVFLEGEMYHISRPFLLPAFLKDRNFIASIALGLATRRQAGYDDIFRHYPDFATYVLCCVFLL